MVVILTKTSKETMKKDEMKVLDVLEQHAKESVDEIAKKCGVSRQNVWRVIKRLEEDKIIWGYTAITDKDTRNLKHFIGLLKKNSAVVDDAMKKEIMFDKLDNHPPGLIKIENIYYTHGIADWIFTFYAPDIVTAKRFIEHTIQRLNKYIQEYTLIETLFPVRKQGLKNPQIKDLVKYL